jgi:3-oxoacyl-[acyl-carrier-protein] synthase II
MGSLGGFLVLEARDHAAARGRTPYARIGPVLSDQSRRKPGDAAAKAAAQFEQIATAAKVKPLAVLSGATGVAQATREEHDFLAGLITARRIDTVRATANVLGSGVSATFPAMVGLAALALSRRGFYRPADETGFELPAKRAPAGIVVTTWGIWRGEGMGLVESA